MWTPELVVSITSFVLTFATMLYKFGRLEGKVVAQLEQHETRLARVERVVDQLHAGV